MKKVMAMLLTGAMIIGLIGCGSSKEETGVTEEVISITDTEETTEEAATAEETELVRIDDSENFDFDYYKIGDWQQAYKDVLDEFRANRSTDEYLNSNVGDIDGYFLADITHDDIPELIVRTGTCEADYCDTLYVYGDDGLTTYTDIPGGHTGYYEDPNGKGILSVYGHMGMQFADSLYIENGELQTEEVFTEDISDDPDAEYTAISTAIPGAVYCSEFNYQVDLPLVEYYGATPTMDSSKTNEEVHALLEACVEGKGTVIPVFAEHFRSDLAEMTFAKLCEGGNYNEYAEGLAQVDVLDFQDLNGDGQDELLAGFADDGGLCVLSYQNGRIYAYIANYENITDGYTMEGTTIVPASEYSSPIVMHFNKEEGYYTYVVD